MSRLGRIPRAGTRAYRALERLYQVGGRASHVQWMRSVSWCASAESFDIDVVYYLVNSGMVQAAGEDFKITDAGLELLGVAPDTLPCAEPVIVGPRYSVGIRDLDLARHCRQPLVREGSLSFRDIPSLMGNERVVRGEKAGTRSADGKQ